MGWFTRVKEGITTATEEKKETPEGLWYKCPSCKEVMTSEDHENSFWVCANCGYHEKIGSAEYFALLFDDHKHTEIGEDLIAGDPLHFQDTKKYTDRLTDSRAKTGLNDAIRAAYGRLEGRDVVIACMDFRFIGGSMGSVVGEKIALAVDRAIKRKCPVIIISKSGGARMMEAGFSLMQMAKTSAKLSLLARKKLPYISLLTDPTTGGVTASFAMLGDMNIAEPGALIGFAGPRVVRETIGKDLPEGFQTSEFVLEHGFLDLIVERKQLKTRLGHILRMLQE
ncbi:MAG TPA: acetyl-CoA carboxylase, carboxyltransferase subunit beta [Flavobacteriales bacterium]|nr:acetyl-CoA carboxylase carboxyltransferase subunit beta [Flavobacteriales bacterium]MCB0789109.1 acetyl-CoA carboxylase carboxyltransferase subunit beta [Flavobacteriales bacterium]MCB0807923.1 acetyl-CoA carboxylase carboxyltransferase subunit beta [Flavobacteriales bacterium]MCB0811711.1 acetyl-CoA carboxylase carboxyltransferase subunit beta [Flavobacteriales bacterium]MCB0817543.1 acetyl-CoA carboxylase carboxyltransferase subunit beta [Flavobacteriales bacterium]